MGLESSNENVLKNVINKNLSLKKLSDTIELIHSHGRRVVLNVLYGLWYDKQEMQQDFLDTCHWADSHGADEIIAFLINVKPGTYVEKLFNEGNFVLPSHREFISIIKVKWPNLMQNLFLMVWRTTISRAQTWMHSTRLWRTSSGSRNEVLSWFYGSYRHHYKASLNQRHTQPLSKPAVQSWTAIFRNFYLCFCIK